LDDLLDDLLESETFINGVAVGVSLHQKAVVSAHERKEPLKIGDTLYYIQNGRERLKDVLEKICR